MRLSVIIPTLNAEKQIGLLLSKLYDQTLPPYEIIVVDSSSDDKTRAIAESAGAKVLVIPRNDFRHGRTRNEAVKRAEGDILIFLTQDALPANDEMLSHLTAPLKDPLVGASYGRHVPKPTDSPVEQFVRFFNYPPASRIQSWELLPEVGIKALFFSNVCSAIKKDIFEEIHGFPENVVVAEDFYFAAKLLSSGYKIAYTSRAEVIHSHNYTLSSLFRRYFDVGAAFSEMRPLLSDGILQNEGKRFVINCLHFLRRNQQYRYLPQALVHICVKWLAFQLGSKSSYFPKKVKKWLSMHPHYWE